MSDSLRDQLMQLGFKPPAKPPREARPDRRPHKGAQGPRKGRGKGHEQGRAKGGKPGIGGAKPAAAAGGEIDLARAYALRQREEQAERQRQERERQLEAQRRREARQALAKLLEGKTLNRADADVPRHFESGGKIRRVYVTAEQFRAINAGELAVVQLAGRHLLVDAALGRQAAQIQPEALVLLVDPDADNSGDDYADPRFQVPDDLVW